VALHRALLATCVQLLGDDFTDIIEITKQFVTLCTRKLTPEHVEQIVGHYADFGKASLVREELRSRDGDTATSRDGGGSGMSRSGGGTPIAFLSYCHESPELIKWVRDLAAKLRSDGVKTLLDRWETAPGDQLPEFMERAVRESDFVLVVCTPKYRARSDKRKGGVGYEGDIMTAEVWTEGSRRKFIPLLRGRQWGLSAPSWLRGSKFIDLRGDPYQEDRYEELLDTLLGRRETAPPVAAPGRPGP